MNGIEKLHAAIERGKAAHGIALLTHAVAGYPSFAHNERSIAALCEAGAEMMELQFPFSDPVADGPVLTHANQLSVEQGTTVDQCFDLGRRAVAMNPDAAFITMTYLNLIYRRGIDTFVADLAAAGISAIIVPDLPPEEATAFQDACARHGIGTIFLVTPVTPSERIQLVASISTGFVYCVGRPGVSGDETAFDDEMLDFLRNVRAISDVPVGVGFGVRTPKDVEALTGEVDIAIVCTEVIRRVDRDGIESAASYLGSLRPSLVDA
jgi:tryptophan synthase alpha chain